MSFYNDNKELFMTPQVNQYGSHQVMTNVCKETKTKWVNLDTKFCDDLYTNTNNPTNTYTYNTANFNFSLPEKITDVKGLYVENMEFPCIFNDTSYNISSAIGNNTCSITLATQNTLDIPATYNQTVVITVPDGLYNRGSLITALNTALSTGITTGGYTSIKQVFFNYTTNNSTFYSYFYTTCEHNMKYTVNFAVDISGNFNKYGFKNTLGWLLGFRNPTYSITTDASNLYAANSSTVPLTPYSYSVMMNSFGVNYRFISENNFTFQPYTKYYYLVIDEFSNNFQNSFISTLPFSLINKYIIAKVCVNPSSFLGTPTIQFITATPSNGSLISSVRNYSGKTDLQKLNVKIIDENGVVINTQGYNFSFCLRVVHE